MTRPLPARLTDLKRFTFAWPLVSFAILTGHVRADFDLLAAKHAGRGFAGAVAAIYPDDVAALRAAATRLDWAEDWTKAVLGHGLPLVVAATARAPLALSTIRRRGGAGRGARQPALHLLDPPLPAQPFAQPDPAALRGPGR
jgi:hypothetical protein